MLSLQIMPFDSFISIKTSTISQFRGFDGLTINHSNTGFGSSAHFYSGLPMEKGVNLEPSLVLAPFIVVVTNTLPGRKIFGKHSPLSTRDHSIQNGVYDNSWFPFTKVSSTT